MKMVLISFVWLFMLSSCGTMRKWQNYQEKVEESVVVETIAETHFEKMVDTSKIEHGKITITEIEFFPPTPIVEDVQEKPKSELLNIGKVNGSIKSIKQTIIESDIQEKGETKEVIDESEKEIVIIQTEKQVAAETKQEPTTAAFKWRIALYIIVVVLVSALYMKRKPVLNWIKKSLSRIFKKP